jgi:Tfp pilus assembly protein FimT
VILAIAATLVVPTFGESDSTRLAAAARLLIADLQFAQAESIAHADDPRGLKFDTSAHAYSVVTSAAPGSFDCDAVSVLTNPADQQPYTTQYGTGRASELSGVTITGFSLGGDACLVFGRYGETDQTAAATVTLTAGSLDLLVSIDPISGEVTFP